MKGYRNYHIAQYFRGMKNDLVCHDCKLNAEPAAGAARAVARPTFLWQRLMRILMQELLQKLEV